MTHVEAEQTGIDRAIAVLGGAMYVASLAGVSYQAVQKWRRKGGVPPEHVERIETATHERGRRVGPHELCPRIFTPQMSYVRPARRGRRGARSS